MNNTRKDSIHNIKVIDAKTGKFFQSCSHYVANKKVINGSAVWINKNTILVLINHNDNKIINKEVIREAGSICYICGDTIVHGEETVDHIIPRGLGGPDIKLNKKCCCRRCNSDKNKRTLKQYLFYIEKHKNKYLYISNEQLKKLKTCVNVIENKVYYFIKSIKHKR